jgi:HSP20 family protein
MFVAIRSPNAAAALGSLLGSFLPLRPASPSFAKPLPRTRPSVPSMALSVEEIDGGYVAAVDLPGLPKEAIEVEVDANVVTISVRAQAAADKAQGDKVLYSERRMSGYRRSFALPAEVDMEKSSAKYENGVLTLTLARAAEPKTTKQLTVQ